MAAILRIVFFRKTNLIKKIRICCFNEDLMSIMNFNICSTFSKLLSFRKSSKQNIDFFFKLLFLWLLNKTLNKGIFNSV
jgi:hypothetical protein